MDMNVVLASGSPRRRELLAALGWSFEVIVPEVDETPYPQETPENLCCRLSAIKAQAILVNPEVLVIAADTIVVINSNILGKPSTPEESFRMLKQLEGRCHKVYTGISVRFNSQVITCVECTSVTFRALTDEAISAYVKTKEGMDKAGAYAIQGMGALLVSGIEGDYFNVVGLPLHRLGLMLEGIGIPLTTQWGSLVRR